MASGFENRPKVSVNVIPSAASEKKSFPEVAIPGPAALPVTPVKLPNPEIYRDEIQEIAKDFKSIPVSTDTLNENLNDRVKQTRVDNVDGKPFSVGLYDIDEALGYYFRNVIKPTVIENGQVKPVDILYGDPERWAAMQKFGFYRDSKGKLMMPLIMYRKTNVSRNENLIFPRVDVSQLNFTSQKKWDVKNRYDKFNVLNKNTISKPDKFQHTSIPNYIQITYECVIWTSFIEQMNKVVESINFSDGTYWGDKNKFKFRTMLDAYNTAVELSSETERMVKSDFTLNVYGYILPEYFADKRTTQISTAVKHVVFTAEGEAAVLFTKDGTVLERFGYDAGLTDNGVNYSPEKESYDFDTKDSFDADFD